MAEEVQHAKLAIPSHCITTVDFDKQKHVLFDLATIIRKVLHYYSRWPDT